ncbi:MAG: hypothetical protein CL696_08045 [Chloroflexi bacterium]|nr:hypothetical protein [Chloroflexota bacterium]
MYWSAVLAASAGIMIIARQLGPLRFDPPVAPEPTPTWVNREDFNYGRYRKVLGNAAAADVPDVKQERIAPHKEEVKVQPTERRGLHNRPQRSSPKRFRTPDLSRPRVSQNLPGADA